MKPGLQVVQRGHTSGISLSLVDVVKPDNDDVDNFIQSIKMVRLEFSISNTLEQGDIHVFGNLNNIHLQSILNISMYVEISSSNTRKIKFGYSLSERGTPFDGYLTEEQDIRTKGTTHNQLIEITRMSTNTIRLNVMFFIVKVISGRRLRIRVTAGVSV